MTRLSLLCQMKLHRAEATWQLVAESSCVNVKRCRACAQELQTETFHSWGEPQGAGDGPDPCAAKEICKGCGEERVVVAHAYQSYPGDQVPLPPRSQEPFERTSCHRIEVCTRCDSVGSYRAYHDFFRGYCRNCNYLADEA